VQLAWSTGFTRRHEERREGSPAIHLATGFSSSPFPIPLPAFVLKGSGKISNGKFRAYLIGRWRKVVRRTASDLFAFFAVFA
jgi:hypothetical protein